jgi:hypothetical protein
MTTSFNPKADLAGFNDRFFHYFQHEVTALQEEMETLAATSTVNGERNDAVDHCLAGIARLSQEVSEASRHLPAYDQRTYSEAVKGLSEKLVKVRESFAPRPKFTFKKALQTRQKMASLPNPVPSSGAQQQEEEVDNAAEVANTLVRDASSKSAIIHRPDFESARSITLKEQKNVYIAVPPSARGRDGRAARILSISNSIIDLRGANRRSSTASNGSRRGSGDVVHPLATLIIKGATNSVLVCGRVSGAVHVTGLRDSVLVAACRQLRMHECLNVQVYIHCPSKPIIEACEKVGFAPLPDSLVSFP